MGIRQPPAHIKIARRLIKIKDLTVPFNLEALVMQYAEVCYKPIPISGVDGVTINLKIPFKKPTIVVNTNQSKARQKFTLAHELGHVLIPSHTGTIVDDIYTKQALDMQYYFIEQEANEFAAELLMPVDWVKRQYEDLKNDLSTLHRQITSVAGVSDIAAAIRLVQVLPPEIVFIAVDGSEVIHTGRTSASTSHIPDIWSKFERKFYKYVKHHSIYNSGSIEYHWYDLNAMLPIDVSDTRSWRDILNQIVDDIEPPYSREAFKRSINGIISNANSVAKRNPNYSQEFLILAMKNKIEREELEQFIKHKDFESFVQKRAYDFYHGIKK